jgi:Single-strand binding protein family
MRILRSWVSPPADGSRSPERSHTGDAVRNRHHADCRVAGERAADRYTLICEEPPIGHRDVQQRETALALGSGSLSMTAARTTGTRSSGSPARTTACPTPSSGPHPAHPCRHGPERVGPNANQHQQPAAQGVGTDGSGQPHTIVGNLVEDPEVRFTQSGIAVTNLRVAVTQRVQQDGQWCDGDTSFFKVNVWRGQVENLAESLGKGDRVMVTGRLRQRSWHPRRRQAVGHRDRGQ